MPPRSPPAAIVLSPLVCFPRRVVVRGRFRRPGSGSAVRRQQRPPRGGRRRRRRRRQRNRAGGTHRPLHQAVGEEPRGRPEAAALLLPHRPPDGHGSRRPEGFRIARRMLRSRRRHRFRIIIIIVVVVDDRDSRRRRFEGRQQQRPLFLHLHLLPHLHHGNRGGRQDLPLRDLQQHVPLRLHPRVAGHRVDALPLLPGGDVHASDAGGGLPEAAAATRTAKGSRVRQSSEKKQKPRAARSIDAGIGVAARKRSRPRRTHPPADSSLACRSLTRGGNHPPFRHSERARVPVTRTHPSGSSRCFGTNTDTRSEDVFSSDPPYRINFASRWNNIAFTTVVTNLRLVAKGM
mmetsp:Transcript_9092/g.22247  ORF Transcript_9092/g.22247 Transcript_9092/m.22247 type:complete len:347 (-) Transcript_9092:22-1062(-)